MRRTIIAQATRQKITASVLSAGGVFLLGDLTHERIESNEIHLATKTLSRRGNIVAASHSANHQTERF
jgi:hypothetical protein